VDPLSGIVSGVRSGTATITATTTYYGVTKRDSVRLTIDGTILTHVELTPSSKPDGSTVWSFSPQTVILDVGGTVVFGGAISVGTNKILDVVFDDPSVAQPSPLPMTVTGAMAGSGNIAPIQEPTEDDIYTQCIDPDHPEFFIYLCQAGRAFFTPGTYHYHSATYGTTWTVIVRGH
jgi:hypothetical protein